MRIRQSLPLLLALAPVSLLSQQAHLLRDDFDELGASSVTSEFTQLGSTVFFSATDGGNGTELWKTDGTAAGTGIVRDIRLGPDSSTPNCLQVYGGKLIFTASEESTGTQFWQSDGTAAGTKPLILLGAANGGATVSGCPVVLNGKLIFTVSSPSR